MGKGTVYLIHLDAPIAHARHYIGYSQNADDRLEVHRANGGARLLAVANERGISYQIVRVWKAYQAFERTLKRRKNAPRYCPICRGEWY